LAEMAQKKQYSARNQLEKKRAMKKPNETLMKELAKAEKDAGKEMKQWTARKKQVALFVIAFYDCGASLFISLI
jgi:hypothetical protein